MDDFQKILLYAHYDRDNIIDDYVVYCLQRFYNLNIKIIFISNSDLSATELNKVSSYSEKIVLRDNNGYDFGAWKEVLFSYGRTFFSEYDELILTNSSYYGPLFPLEDLFNTMSVKDCDFWGITEHINDNEFPEHLQSYFVLFKRDLFLSDLFWDFWKVLEDNKHWWYYVVKGEIQLSQYLTKHGYKYEVYTKLDDTGKMPEIGFTESFSLNAADLLIDKYKIPFVKIKAFQHTPVRPFNISLFIIDTIHKSGSDYPIDLIVNNLKRTKPLTWQKNLPGTLEIIDITKGIIPLIDDIKIGVFGHFYFDDMFDEVISFLSNIPYNFDLFITTGCNSSEKRIHDKINKSKLKVNMFKTLVVENRGRDVAPWLLEFKEKHLDYDIALKIQTKKSSYAPENFGYKWNEYLMKSLLYSEEYVSGVINLFLNDKNLGIVYPSYPPIINLVTPHCYSSSTEECDFIKIWLKRLNLDPPAETNQPVFPVGTMFWYRPKAIKKLINYNIKLKDFPDEPLPVKGTSVHGLERAISYIIQGHGFSYKHITSADIFIKSYRMYEDNIMSEARLPELSNIYKLELPVRITVKLLLYSLKRLCRKYINLIIS